MGIFRRRESEVGAEIKEEPKPFNLEWVIQGSSHIAQLSVNREHPLIKKSDNVFKDMLTPGLQEIEDQGYTILSIAPTFIDPGNGEALDYVIVAQPSPK